MFLKFRRVCENDEEANFQKRFKQDLCSGEDRPRLPAVLLRSDFCSLEENYLCFSKEAGVDAEVARDKLEKAEVRTTSPVPSHAFEDMSLEQIGGSDYKENKAIIKHSLLSSESSLDGSFKLIHMVNPDDASMLDISQEEPFCPQISSTEVLKVNIFILLCFIFLFFSFTFQCTLDVLQGEESFLFRFDREAKSFFIGLVKIPFHNVRKRLSHTYPKIKAILQNLP